MERNLAGHSIVVINTGMSPAIFNTYWLVTNGILKEEELNANHIFTNQFVEINTDIYSLVINSNSFQISAKNNVNNLDTCVGILVKLLDAIPQTMFISAGINFNWIVRPEDDDYNKLSKQLFFKNDIELYQKFDKDNASFGSYMSCEVDDARLKLDIKPIIISNPSQEKKGAIHFNFNFHYDVPVENRNSQLKEYINKWNFFYQKSVILIETV